MLFKRHMWKIAALVAAILLSIGLSLQTEVKDEKGTIGAPIVSTLVPP